MSPAAPFLFLETIEKLGTDFMLDYMEQLGGWPIMGTHKGGNWDVSKYNLEELMILVRNETNTLPLADIYVSQDDKNPTKHILAVNLGPGSEFISIFHAQLI